jgi:hypothetical protein
MNYTIAVMLVVYAIVLFLNYKYFAKVRGGAAALLFLGSFIFMMALITTISVVYFTPDRSGWPLMVIVVGLPFAASLALSKKPEPFEELQPEAESDFPIRSEDNEEKPWKLHMGCHQGTLMTRDVGDIIGCNSEEECRSVAETIRARWKRSGLKVWFAQAKGPNGENVKVLESEPYRS